ncbi:LytTR family DNA-binding domain-containing protein [Eubacterium sp. 1001713B170207_170306_E7]|uniref:LytR/AlgR family response regulator transcription factor n=1 Tax=Eubacterium sp. 1001713B170207_170306_E7 TaxID=2787097 RepID=UPI0018971649|nr:LytTR family DNA-binding domain-containing protein [Eubacterium sp. 1001713B170207_170306_E7]
MKILLCEDNIEDMEEARACIAAAAEACPEDCVLEVCDSALACRAWLGTGVPDLVFMDIFMGGASGIALAREIRSQSETAQIVFLTCSNEFAAESYEVRAMDYLLKPPSPDQVQRIFEQCMKSRKAAPRHIVIKRGRDEVKVVEAGILYIKTVGNETSVYTKTGVISAYYPLKEIEKQLDPGRFLLIRRGLIASLGYIELVEGDYCVLKNGEEYAISRKNKAEIRKKFYDYQFSQIEGS